MSRTKRSLIPRFTTHRDNDGRDQGSMIPRKLKHAWRQRDRSRAKQRLREGKDPDPCKRNDRWNFL